PPPRIQRPAPPSRANGDARGSLGRWPLPKPAIEGRTCAKPQSPRDTALLWNRSIPADRGSEPQPDPAWLHLLGMPAGRKTGPTTRLRPPTVGAQQTVDVEVVWLPTTHTIPPQATLTQKPAALKQAPRPPVVDPDERVHAIDLILSVSPLKYCGYALA